MADISSELSLSRLRVTEETLAILERKLRELQAPLETIANLSFLAYESLEYPHQAKDYLRSLDEQIVRIADLLSDHPKMRVK